LQENFMETKKTVVYGCSGCSSAGQMANWLAVKHDRRGDADMSCISGVGGNVGPLVRTAQAATVILAIDGCPLHCSLHSLRARGVEPTRHVDLAKLAVPKNLHQDFDLAQAEAILETLSTELRSQTKLANSAG
jgi:uncharacterized metal-binding protein